VIANAVSHRSYLDPAKVQVAIYDDRLEITSPGMLIGGVTIEDLKSGCSRPRNRGIVSALTYMKIIEQWGSGIPKMISACRKAGLPEPELKEMGGSFRVNMFRPGEISSLATTQGTTQATQGATQATQATTQAPLSEAERVLLKEISKHPSISQKQIADELGWSVDRAKYYFKKLKRKGLIKRVGSSQTGHWELLVEEQEGDPWQK
jgi:predicted HTH transcriptional regulator